MTRHSKHPRILMFAPACYPPANPEAFVNANLVSAMLETGWHIDVVSCPQGAGQWYPGSYSMWGDVGKHSYSIREHERTLLNRGFDALETFLLSGQLIGGGRWAVPAVRFALRLAAIRSYDVILSRALPAAAHLAAFIVAGKTKIPWIANWNDPVPDYMFPSPYARRNGGQTQMNFRDGRFFRALTRRAAWHTFPCERLRTYICNYLPGDITSRSTVIPHLASEFCLRRRTPNDKFSLLYAGSLRKPRDPRSFLVGIRKFIDATKILDMTIRFITDKPEDAAGAVREQGLEGIVCIEPGMSYEKMPQILLQADVLVIIEANMKEGIFLPSKFVDYIQVGRPILAISPKEGTLSDILSLQGGGLAVDCGRPDEIAAGIATLYKSWRAGTLDENFGSYRLVRMFERNAVLMSYRKIFGQLGINCL